jgi:hypothetical protein
VRHHHRHRRHADIVVIEGVTPAPGTEIPNLRDEGWSLCLNQRVFGPRRLLMVFADRDGTTRGIAHAPRIDPPEQMLPAYIDYLGAGAAAAVVYCDEPVRWGPPPPELTERFEQARATCAESGIHLVDWFCCDDELFRSSRFALEDPGEWWDVP